MEKLKNKFIKFTGVLLVLFAVQACDLTDLDINTDPNNPAQASLDLLLAAAQTDGIDTYAGGLNDMAMSFVGINSSWDNFNMTNQSWTNTWNFLYAGPLKDLDEILKTTAEQRASGIPNPRYEGIAKVMKAYYYSNMVDLWGDIPYSEGLNGNAEEQVLNPAYDDDAAVYANLQVLLDEAIAHFAETSPVAVKGDLIYNGSAAKWKKAAYSLKLRLLIQTRRVNSSAKADIEALMTAAAANGGFITSPADDFQYTFSTTNNPDNRHPMYRSGYSGGEAGYSYFGHQYMYEMLANNDPRRPFYFKRQTSTILNPLDATDRQTIPCSQRDDCVYGYFPTSPTVTMGIYGKTPDELTSDEAEFLAGFFGRDRADPSGVPNDNSLRTTVGLYPAGGLYDDVPELGGGNKGAGNGIFPMITSWMVKLYQIEASLALGVDVGDARALFEAAMTEQLAKVNSFAALDPDAVAMSDDEITDWVDFRLAEYDAASTDEEKLMVVLKEAWFMNFGNGYELYNAFRRTGYPADIQTPLDIPRQFALRLPYVQDELNLNSSTPTIVYDAPEFAVFWDALKFQF
jgi:hypothetical protein